MKDKRIRSFKAKRSRVIKDRKRKARARKKENRGYSENRKRTNTKRASAQLRGLENPKRAGI